MPHIILPKIKNSANVKVNNPVLIIYTILVKVGFPSNFSAIMIKSGMAQDAYLPVLMGKLILVLMMR